MRRDKLSDAIAQEVGFCGASSDPALGRLLYAIEHTEKLGNGACYSKAFDLLSFGILSWYVMRRFAQTGPVSCSMLRKVNRIV